MPPISLAPRSARYLSLAEREEIAILRAQGAGVRDIARRLRRAPSTVSRELRRNAATRSGGLAYRASTAQWHSARRAKRPKIAKLAANDRLRSSEDKHRQVFDAGHAPLPRSETIRETLAWFDKYLGPVN